MNRNTSTTTRKRVYDMVKQYINTNGHSPTVRELCILTGLASTSTVHSHLRRLKEMGLVDFDAECPRTLVILEDFRED